MKISKIGEEKYNIEISEDELFSLEGKLRPFIDCRDNIQKLQEESYIKDDIGEKGIKLLRRISDRGFDIAQDFCNQVNLVTGYDEG